MSRASYKRLGDYIREVDVRNEGLKVNNLLGLTINKEFIRSVANTVGTDMEKYKIIRKNQFACSTMQVRRDGKMPIALLKDDEAIISQAYPIFEVIDEKELLPDYLMMWFTRSEFDREACFHAVGGVRGSIEWEDFLDMQLPIPSLEKQREIVAEYNAVQRRIDLNNQLIQKLEETAQAIYKQRFVEFEEEELNLIKLGEICTLITDGKHGDCENEMNSGFYFISVKDIIGGRIVYENARQINGKDFQETHKRTALKAGDILLTNTGTIGRMMIVQDIPETSRTTFQKSVAILKPNHSCITSSILYLTLDYYLKDIIDLAGGSTQSNLLLGDLKKFEIKLPKMNSILLLESKIASFFITQNIKRIENCNLNELQSLLLSKMARSEN